MINITFDDSTVTIIGILFGLVIVAPFIADILYEVFRSNRNKKNK